MFEIPLDFRLIRLSFLNLPQISIMPSGHDASRSMAMILRFIRKFRLHRRRDLTDVGQQLHAVMAASFQRQRILSYEEYRAFHVIEKQVAEAYPGYRVFAQASLGEILHCSDPDAYRSINSKRVDILIIDRSGWPVLAAEYQGGGHYQGTAAGRDAVKKEALRKAGVRYVEIFATDSEEQIRYRVREQLGVNKAVA
jgi:hypothetical protein